MSDRTVTPMRVQVKVDDGTDEGAWLTVFEGCWADLPGSLDRLDESTEMAREQADRDEEQA